MVSCSFSSAAVSKLFSLSLYADMRNCACDLALRFKKALVNSLCVEPPTFYRHRWSKAHCRIGGVSADQQRKTSSFIFSARDAAPSVCDHFMPRSQVAKSWQPTFSCRDRFVLRVVKMGETNIVCEAQRPVRCVFRIAALKTIAAGVIFLTDGHLFSPSVWVPDFHIFPYASDT